MNATHPETGSDQHVVEERDETNETDSGLTNETDVGLLRLAQALVWHARSIFLRSRRHGRSRSSTAMPRNFLLAWRAEFV